MILSVRIAAARGRKSDRFKSDKRHTASMCAPRPGRIGRGEVPRVDVGEWVEEVIVRPFTAHWPTADGCAAPANHEWPPYRGLVVARGRCRTTPVCSS
jgi:hypothetical protein